MSLIRTSQGDTVYGNPVEFYLYHSSDCSIEKVTAPTYLGPGVDFDITSIVKPGYFYGGVATDYGGKGTVATAIENGDFSMFDGATGVNDDGESYDGNSLTTESASFWTFTDFLSTKFAPQSKMLYYVKEVPEIYTEMYFQPFLSGSGTSRVITQAYSVSFLDDLNYKGVEVEYEYSDGEIVSSVGTVVTSLTLRNGSQSITLTSTKVRKVPGYVIYNKEHPNIGGVNSGKDCDFTVTFKVYTPDGVCVQRSGHYYGNENWTYTSMSKELSSILYS